METLENERCLTARFPRKLRRAFDPLQGIAPLRALLYPVNGCEGMGAFAPMPVLSVDAESHDAFVR